MKVKILLVGFLMIILSISYRIDASPLDFSWNAPKTYVHNEGTSGEIRYIIWFYNLGNTLEKPILVPIEVFLMTDTGEKCLDTYYPDIMEHVAKLDEDYKEGKKYQCAIIAKGELAPKTTKHCIAMFEDIDPNTKRLDIFVTGISHFFFWRWRMIDYSYKITYEKELDHWKLIEHGMSKDASHRSYEFESRDW
ncbi:MAG: hypothetical protein QY310_09790 [Candidatus Jettenia sp. CY-1]|nr:hypothetical protein [Candidatus Jettenia sp.]WKZ17724.1 MAG: hypothetical protein QY310_09790 [Candidatus Jettenia sp. CY-1]